MTDNPTDLPEAVVERVARAHSPDMWRQIDEHRCAADFYRSKVGQVGYRDGNADAKLKFHEKRVRELTNDQLSRARAALAKLESSQ